MSIDKNHEDALKIISEFIQSKKEPEFDCEACRIEHYDEQVKQKSGHTCGIDGPNDDIDRIKSGKKKNDSPNSDPHEAEVRRIAEVLAKVLHPTAFSDRLISIQDGRYWQIKIDSYMDSARAMVAEMANSYVTGYTDAVSQMKANLHCDKVDRDLSLIEHGLIPSPSNATGSDTGK